jgi:hypothetical protein
MNDPPQAATLSTSSEFTSEPKDDENNSASKSSRTAGVLFLFPRGGNAIRSLILDDIARL